MKYTYPVKFASNTEAAYIRDDVVNSGALFMFYRTAITAIQEPCASTWLVYEGDLKQCSGSNCLIQWAESLRDMRTGCSRWSGWNGNEGTYHFFAYFTPDTSITCPPTWQGIVSGTQVRVKVTETGKEIRQRQFESVDINCDWPVGCPVSVTAPSFYYVGDPTEIINYIQLTLTLPSTINEAEAKWDELSEGIAGDFPLSGTENRYFYAYGTGTTGTPDACRKGIGFGDALSGLYIPSPWMDGHVLSDAMDDPRDLTEHYITTTDARIEVNQSSTWQDSGIWVGNSIHQVAFSSGYWESHVFDLDA